MVINAGKYCEDLKITSMFSSMSKSSLTGSAPRKPCRRRYNGQVMAFEPVVVAVRLSFLKL